MSLTSMARGATSRRSVRAANDPRSTVTSARETLALVLDEDSPIPEGDQDIDDLVLRLRGHLMQLGPAVHVHGIPRQAESALRTAQSLADIDVPARYMQARVHLRKLATAVKALITEMGAAGLVCDHQPECPPAQAADSQAAQVRFHRPEAGWSVLCNGVLLFDDTGCLRPDDVIVEPHRPLPLAGPAAKAVSG
ncbi:DUF5999 family protein [Streptomyces sp. NPDC102441]|uniref:DUF5999 family protein n=1 Tax=Streptomyces sp. NPDC102441 TaxID=3366176 RepID=UPI0037F577D1